MQFVLGMQGWLNQCDAIYQWGKEEKKPPDYIN